MTSKHCPQGWEVAGTYDPHHPIGVALRGLVTQVFTLREQYGLLSAHYAAELARAEAKWRRFYEDHTERTELTLVASVRGDAVQYDAPPVKQPKYLAALHELDSAAAMQAHLGSMMLLELNADYETFVGNLFRTLYPLRPEIMRASNRSLSYAEAAAIGEAGGIEALFVDHEVEDLLHLSHDKQLEFFANRFGLRTLNKFAEYQDLIELTERRNLFAHTGGRVSAQYLDRTRDSARQPLCQPGDLLSIDEEYFAHACKTIITICTLLTHTLWRKVAPAQRAAADQDLTHLCYTLLAREEWALAQRLLEFAVGLKDYSSVTHKLVFTINYAQTFKWLGDQKACEAVLKGEDWSACDFGLRLSDAVLRSDFATAETLMLLAATTHQVQRRAFDHWPIYREFRATPEFRRAYLRSYGPASWPSPEGEAA